MSNWLFNKIKIFLFSFVQLFLCKLLDYSTLLKAGYDFTILILFYLFHKLLDNFDSKGKLVMHNLLIHKTKGA